MSKFLQLHLLTPYPPGNPNRDDTGRPKSAVFGGVPRLRISSQSLKRAWRESSVFKSSLDGYLSQRTRRLGDELHEYMIENGIADDDAKSQAIKIAKVFGKPTPDSARIQQLCFISSEERRIAFEFADLVIEGEEISPTPQEILRKSDSAADIAMFGRMLADEPTFNREASIQVAHAITTHRAEAEDDYYTALDDLARDDETGAGFLDVQEFGSGVFYLYICVDNELLLKNLDGHEGVKDASLAALIEAAATVSPRGKQASFGTRAVATYILAEKGSYQPRTLATAFLKPVDGKDLLRDSIEKLGKFRAQLESAYGPSSDEQSVMDVDRNEGSLAKLVEFVVT